MGKIPWRREWLPTPVFLPGEVLEKNSMVGYSPWGNKEWNVAARLTISLFMELLKHWNGVLWFILPFIKDKHTLPKMKIVKRQSRVLKAIR